MAHMDKTIHFFFLLGWSDTFTPCIDTKFPAQFKPKGILHIKFGHRRIKAHINANIMQLTTSN